MIAQFSPKFIYPWLKHVFKHVSWICHGVYRAFLRKTQCLGSQKSFSLYGQRMQAAVTIVPKQRLCFPEAQAIIKRHVTEAVAVLLSQKEVVCFAAMPLSE